MTDRKVYAGQKSDSDEIEITLGDVVYTFEDGKYSPGSESPASFSAPCTCTNAVKEIDYRV